MNELYFEEIGDNFDRWMSGYDVQQRIKLIFKLLPPTAKSLRCLEVGCGTGRVSEALFPLLKTLTVVDISQKLAQSVGERLGVDWKACNACQLFYPDESFDLVISSECIEHTENPRQALKEMGRVTKIGGTVIVTSPNRLWFPILLLSNLLRIRKFQGRENWLFPFTAGHALKQGSCMEIRYSGCHLFPWQIPFGQKILPFFDKVGSALFPIMINYAVVGCKRSKNIP